MKFHLGGPVILLLVIFSFNSCNTKADYSDDCRKYEEARSDIIPVDKELKIEIASSYALVLNRFDETSIQGLNHEAYHFVWASAFGSMKSIKFEQKGSYNILTVKCIAFSGNTNCVNYIVEINDDEWRELEEMIYEFYYWSAQTFRNKEEVADGFSIIIAGNRPDAKFCGKQTYKIIARGTPYYDRMGALYESVSSFEEHLKFKYEQSNDLNKKIDLKKLIEKEFHN